MIYPPTCFSLESEMYRKLSMASRLVFDRNYISSTVEYSVRLTGDGNLGFFCLVILQGSPWPTDVGIESCQLRKI